MSERSAATKPEKCGARSLYLGHTCDRPKGHDGAHVAIYANHTVGWGGTK